MGGCYAYNFKLLQTDIYKPSWLQCIFLVYTPQYHLPGQARNDKFALAFLFTLP